MAVGAIVLRDGQLLMVRRARRPAAGLWTLPGGRVEIGESVTDAVEREVLEETGIEVDVGDLAGVFEVVAEDHHYVILDHLAVARSLRDPVAGTDATEARWIALEDIDGLDCTPRLVEMLTTWGVLPEA